jgi:uncharacterized alkaline shock family protein YloU
MGWAKRIFLVLLGIIILLSGLCLVALTLKFFPVLGLNAADLSWLEEDYRFTALGFLIFAIGLLVIILFSSDGKKKEVANIVNFNEIGEYRISFHAIESIIHAAVQKVKGIRETKANIIATEQGLIIYLRIKPIPDLPFPALVRELQDTVKNYVQEISGSNVAEVKVMIENISQEKIQ